MNCCILQSISANQSKEFISLYGYLTIIPFPCGRILGFFIFIRSNCCEFPCVLDEICWFKICPCLFLPNRRFQLHKYGHKYCTLSLFHADWRLRTYFLRILYIRLSIVVLSVCAHLQYLTSCSPRAICSYSQNRKAILEYFAYTGRIR